MKKIIIKTALITLGVVVCCAVAVFAILSFGFPSTVCGWCEQLGNYGFAARYAALCYSYTDDISDLGRCVEDSILAADNDYIAEYAVRLIDHEEFDSFCEIRDEEINESISDNEDNIDFSDVVFSYRHYVYGALSTTYYGAGNFDLALGTAVAALDENIDRVDFSSSAYSGEITEFPISNALGVLAQRVIYAGDSGAADRLLEVLDNVSADAESQAMYLQTIINSLTQL